MTVSVVPPTRLPQFHTQFLGREQEIADVAGLINQPDVRLVTLTGTAGVGKTRIAVEIARQFAALGDRRVIFLPLAASASDQPLAELIDRAMSLEDESGSKSVQTLEMRLGYGAALLVLDNFEHLLGSAVQLGKLLADFPGIDLLVTSRSPLEIRGENAYEVVPFSIPEKVEKQSIEELRKLDVLRLFEIRARAVHHNFEINRSNAAVVAAICRRLDGLPLAIELAAARTRTLAPATLLARFDRPLDLLGQGPEDSPDRHRSLRAALDWSYDLLDGAEQRFFRQLGVPRGSFSLEAAAALAAGTEADPLEAISSLVSKSLVRPASMTGLSDQSLIRFELLSTIRDFALEKLQAEGEYGAAHDQFESFIRNTAETIEPDFPMGPARGTDSFDIAGVDRESVLGVLDWLLKSGRNRELVRLTGVLAPHWFARGSLRDARKWLEAGLVTNPSGDDIAHARAIVSLGMVAIQQGDFAIGQKRLLEGIDLSRAIGEETWLGQASFSLGVLEQDRANPELAVNHFKAAHIAFTASGAISFANVALNNLGLVTARSGRPELGLELIDEARRNHQAAGFDFGVALANRYGGQVLRQMGDLEGARDLFVASLSLQPSLMQGWHIANSIENLAQISFLSGDPLRAASLAEGAGRIREEIGVPIEPALEAEYQTFLLELDHQSGSPSFEAATTKGRELTVQELIEYARDIEATFDNRVRPETPVRESGCPSNGPLEILTIREKEVLRLLIDGLTNPEIAGVLFISPRTVSVHVTHILEKLGAENRSAAVAIALRAGIAPNLESNDRR